MKKKYIITDSCYWYKSKKKRSPHFIEVLDLSNGSIKQVKSGSIIQIVKERK